MTHTLHKGDKVMGLGRNGRIWRTKPVGTVTRVRTNTLLGIHYVRVQWDNSAVEDDMDPTDIVPICWSETIGRYVTIPEDDE
jgi:hypothetical protein